MTMNYTLPQSTDLRDERHILTRERTSRFALQHLATENAPPPYPALPAQTFDMEFTPIRRQVDPSCAVHGVLAAFEHSWLRIKGEKPVLSAQYLYWVARQLAYPNDYDTETRQLAVNHRDVLKALTMYGCCPENQWGERVGVYSIEPPVDRFIHALKYRVTRYSAVAPEMLYTLLQIHVAIAAIAMMHEDWSAPDIWSPDGGITPATRTRLKDPSDAGPQVGYHSICLSGFDHDQGALRIRNSAGIEWADRGYAWLPKSYLSDGLLRDFWCVTAVGGV